MVPELELITDQDTSHVVVDLFSVVASNRNESRSNPNPCSQAAEGKGWNKTSRIKMPAVLTFMETWLTGDVLDSEMVPPSFRDTETKPEEGDGVILFVIADISLPTAGTVLGSERFRQGTTISPEIYHQWMCN